MQYVSCIKLALLLKTSCQEMTKSYTDVENCPGVHRGSDTPCSALTEVAVVQFINTSRVKVGARAGKGESKWQWWLSQWEGGWQDVCGSPVCGWMLPARWVTSKVLTLCVELHKMMQKIQSVTESGPRCMEAKKCSHFFSLKWKQWWGQHVIHRASKPVCGGGQVGELCPRCWRLSGSCYVGSGPGPTVSKGVHFSWTHHVTSADHKAQGQSSKRWGWQGRRRSDIEWLEAVVGARNLNTTKLTIGHLWSRYRERF